MREVGLPLPTGTRQRACSSAVSGRDSCKRIGTSPFAPRRPSPPSIASTIGGPLSWASSLRVRGKNWSGKRRPRFAGAKADLRDAQKLAAIGRLAGGIAHDFNNLLHVIVSYTDILHRRVARDWKALDSIEQVRRACARATDLAQQLLIFSRQQLVDPPVLDLSEVVEEAEKMLRPVLGTRVELLVRATRPLDGVKIDRGSLEQVIMNLVVNARDAMPKGGKVFLATARALLADARGHGAYVMLAVSDQGTGMDAATRARVFEPFFTTKGPGKGTGLGLATVRVIVEQVGGFVDLRSEPGKGTTVEVYLPSIQLAERG